MDNKPPQRYIVNPKKVQNYVLPTNFNFIQRNPTGNPNNANQYISRVQLARVRQDVMTWRMGIDEAEKAWLPYRVKIQQMFIDTILNGHVDACLTRRRDLTLLKEFTIADKNGKVDDYWTSIFKQQWFYDSLVYIIDAQFYGYSLINWCGLDKDAPQELQLIKRAHVSPDRFNISPFVYSAGGETFMNEDDALYDWTLYIPTPTENGITPCGYGLLYKVAYYEIFLRNLMGYNGDFVELYSQPYRVGKTSKTTESERADFERSLRDMGSAAYALIDPDDEIEFIETSQSGTGWKGYENLEIRCEKKISKILLGHADAMDSTPGKLGSGQGGEESPAAQALSAVSSAQNKFVCHIVNDLFIPRLQHAGLNIPNGLGLLFSNDDELQDQRKKEDESNNATADFAYKLSQAGYQVDDDWLSKRLGDVPIKSIPKPEPVAEPSGTKAKNIVDKLKKLYGK